MPIENPKVANGIGWQRVEPRGGGVFKLGGKKTAHVRVLNTLGNHCIHGEANVGLWIGTTIVRRNLKGVKE